MSIPALLRRLLRPPAVRGKLNLKANDLTKVILIYLAKDLTEVTWRPRNGRDVSV